MLNPLKSGDEDEEYRSDKTVQISMKELLDLFEDEYFVRGRNIPVDRLRKRLETIDKAQMAKIGFSPDQMSRLGRQLCEQIQLLVQNAMICGELVGAEAIVSEALLMLVGNNVVVFMLLRETCLTFWCPSPSRLTQSPRRVQRSRRFRLTQKRNLVPLVTCRICPRNLPKTPTFQRRQSRQPTKSFRARD